MSYLPSQATRQDLVEAERRAMAMLEAVLDLASEIVLDLEIEWTTARRAFARRLFERAQRRYGTRAKVAAALNTTVRTVQQIVTGDAWEGVPGAGTIFNMRRRILQLLDRGPATMRELERVVPSGSDVNFVKEAVRSLVGDKLLTEDAVTHELRRPNPEFRPWYLRPEVFAVWRIRLILDSLAELLRSRITPKVEDASPPAVLISAHHNVSVHRVREYIAEIVELLARFDQRWDQLTRSESGSFPVVEMATVLAAGRGRPLTPDERERLTVVAGEREPSFGGDVGEVIYTGPEKPGSDGK